MGIFSISNIGKMFFLFFASFQLVFLPDVLVLSFKFPLYNFYVLAPVHAAFGLLVLRNQIRNIVFNIRSELVYNCVKLFGGHYFVKLLLAGQKSIAVAGYFFHTLINRRHAIVVIFHFWNLRVFGSVGSII